MTAGAPVVVHLIVVAGGQGLRAAGADGVPKQFRATGRGMLLRVGLETFLAGSAAGAYRLASVAVAAPEDWHARVAADLADLRRPVVLAGAGPTRTASTWQAALALEAHVHPGARDLVAVHDAARPFASAALLARVAAAAAASGGAVPGLPVTDTIVSDHDGTAHYLPRERLLAVQTPQVFRWDIFLAAHRWAAAHQAVFTDDGGLLTARGHGPVLVAGEADNWKVTTEADWRRAAHLLGR